MGVIGIDFGTTTTVAAFSTETGSIRVLQDSTGSAFPSVVAFPPNGSALVGFPAKQRRVIDPPNTIFSVKRILGQPWDSRMVSEFSSKYPFTLERIKDVPCFKTRAGLLSPVDVSATLLKHIRQLAQRMAPKLGGVVVGVPVDFGQRQRDAILEALQKAGFLRAECVDEPLAIARACLREHPGVNGTFVVYDLGGGTFDLAICEQSENGCKLLASGGDEYLGGDDVDQLLADWVIEQMMIHSHWNIRTSVRAAGRLLEQCERAKIALSTEHATKLDLGIIEKNDAFSGKHMFPLAPE